MANAVTVQEVRYTVTIEDGGSSRVISVPMVQQTKVSLLSPTANTRMADALDVDMAQASDGAVPVWRPSVAKFEVLNGLRNQSLDGGSF